MELKDFIDQKTAEIEEMKVKLTEFHEQQLIPCVHTMCIECRAQKDNRQKDMDTLSQRINGVSDLLNELNTVYGN